MAGKKKKGKADRGERRSQSIDDVIDNDSCTFDSFEQAKNLGKPELAAPCALDVSWDRIHNHRVPINKRVLGNITYGDVERAIWRSEGMLTNVARMLKISVYQVKNILSKYKLLKQDFEEYREALLDEAETFLRAKIRRGDTASIIFFLKCLGKNRGFIESESGKASRGSVRMKIVPATDANVKKVVKQKESIVESPAATEDKPMGKVVMMPVKAEVTNG
jgi:hypothetical protein